MEAPAVDDKGIAYKDLFEEEQRQRKQADADRDEAVKRYNTVVDEFNTVMNTIRMSILKANTGLMGDLTNIGWNAARYDKVEVEKK